MKIGTGSTQYTRDYKGILIEDYNDLRDYIQFSNREIELGIRSVIKSPEPLSRWDHLCPDPSTFGALFHMSVIDCKMNGGNPLLNLDKWTQRKYEGMFDSIQEGYCIIVNKVGGWCPFNRDSVDLLENVGYEPNMNYFINDRFKDQPTQYINIENDPDLEQYTREHLYKLDSKYSYIRNALHLTRDQFDIIFTEFKSKGGKGVWVYTTGMDTDQMRLYTNTAIECGLTEFIFVFNSGTSLDIVDFIKHYCKIVSINFRYSFV